MARAASDVLREMLELPESQRLGIVAEVLARAHGEPDPDWEAAWLAELDRREATEPAEPPADEDWSLVRARLLGGSSGRGG